MECLLDYVKWRGDLSFTAENFNKLDALIFSQITLLDLEPVFVDTDSISVHDALKKYLQAGHKLSDSVGYVISNNVHYLFDLISKANRYKNLIMSNYQKFVANNNNQEIQFCALTIEISDHHHLISFGGTDDSLIGWIEDFMLIYGKNLEGQNRAYDYLNACLKNTTCEYTLCGHSKGGNLAIYALLNLPDNEVSRIRRVYNFDGPGMSNNLFLEEGYESKWKKVHTYLPYRCTIGRLFKHLGKERIVYSSGDIAFQHDVFTWKIIGKEFTYMRVLSDESIYLEYRIKEILKTMDYDTRVFFVDSFRNYLKICNVTTVTELFKNKSKMVLCLMKLKKDERAIINKIFIKGLLMDNKIVHILFDSVSKKITFKLSDEDKKRYIESNQSLKD